jgi:hypothetical protein
LVSFAILGGLITWFVLRKRQMYTRADMDIKAKDSKSWGPKLDGNERGELGAKRWSRWIPWQ